MTNVRFDSIEKYNDTGLKNMYDYETKNGMSHEEMMTYIWINGRDNARTPMQWSNEPNAGFTTGTPWFSVNPNYPDINVEEAVNNPDSIVNYYKKMIELRKSTPALIYGAYELIAENHPHVFAYLRLYKDKRYAVIVNLFNEPAEISLDDDLMIEELLLSNYSSMDPLNNTMQLEPYEARLYRLSNQ
jgi:glycosidase